MHLAEFKDIAQAEYLVSRYIQRERESKTETHVQKKKKSKITDYIGNVCDTSFMNKASVCFLGWHRLV